MQLTRNRSGAPSSRGSVCAAGAGVVLVMAAAGSDFVFGSFWAHHTMLTSLFASLLVVVISIAVINELIERRNRRRWSLLAQNVLFALVQTARLTWTGLLDLLGVTESYDGLLEGLRAEAQVALDTQRVSDAIRELLAEPDRCQLLQRTVERLSNHCNEVIARWATVMVGAAPYAELLDRHVELQGRLEWLSSVLAHNQPALDDGGRSHRLNRASVAAEQAHRFDDEWMHDMLVSIIRLATRLDSGSQELAFSLASADWWEGRTQTLANS
jgi:hypothetical protein